MQVSIRELKANPSHAIATAQPRGKVIEPHHLMSRRQKTIYQRASDKTGGAGDQHFQLLYLCLFGMRASCCRFRPFGFREGHCSRRKSDTEDIPHIS